MRVLVTGASGFVGSHLTPALAEAGHDVFALVRDPASYTAPEGVAVVEADLAEPLEAEKLPEADAIVHLAQANVPAPDEALTLYRVNTTSTLELLELARRTGTRRFVYASSASVYGFGDRRFSETDSVAPRDLYAVTKVNSEYLVAAYGSFFGTIVFRLVAPYGPGQTVRMISGLIGRVAEGRPVTLNDRGRPRMNPIYVADAVAAFVAALDLAGNHVVNLAGPDIVSIRELAAVAGQVLRREPVFEEGAGAVTGDIVADTSRLHELFDIEETVGIAEGIRRTIEASG
jgi:UDP-glucose 4-epimerase